MTKTRWCVEVLEFERGWGSRIDFTEEFETHEAAKDWQTHFNSQNTETTVPDWYMVAKDPYPIKVLVEKPKLHCPMVVQ